MEMKPWFIDAWAVHDGLAFASRREPESIDAVQTVFMSVPGLEAVPIGRISTALLAGRFNFQEGFRDREGREIPFESLAEVREAVRRAYLLDGLGGDEPEAGAAQTPPGPEGGAPAGTPEVPFVPAPQGGKFYDQIVRENVATIAPGEFVDLVEPAKQDQVFSAIRNGKFLRRVWPLLEGFAGATVLSWAPRIASGDEREKAAFFQWVLMLSRMELWHDQTMRQVMEGQSRALDEIRPFIELAVHQAQAPLMSLPTAVPSGLTYGVPCPLRRDWHPGIRTLSDKLLLALGLRAYYLGNSELPEFVPALLAAMFQVSSHAQTNMAVHLARGQRESWARREAVFFRALDWLKRELPKYELHPEAELALEKFAYDRLDAMAESHRNSGSAGQPPPPLGEGRRFRDAAAEIPLWRPWEPKLRRA